MLLPVIVFLASIALIAWLLRRAIREERVSPGWVRGQRVTDVRAVGLVEHQLRAGGAVLLQDADESKVRAVGLAIAAARGGER